ncbi:MAG: ABC transporter permease [Coxiellaceae bacterium]|nr:ABC transporter permease [Coxiellaceae bacterium]
MVSALTRKLLRDIRDMKGQVVSIALVVCMGVAVLIGSLSTYNSLKAAQLYFYNYYQFADVFVSLKSAPNSLITRIANIPGVANVNTRILEEVNLEIPDMTEPAVGLFVSIPENRSTVINRVHIREGRQLEPHQNQEILVSEAFAKEHHLRPGDTLVAVVNERRETFHIVGIAISPEFIYTVRAGQVLPDNIHYGVFWLNHDAMSSAFNMEGAFNSVVIQLAPKTSPMAIVNKLDQLLLPYGGLGAITRDEQVSHVFLSNEFDQLEFLATVIPGIFIGIAAFLLNMVTGRLVALQREHIAIVKSIGYSNWTVGNYYLKLVIVIVVLGTFLGVGFGAWMGNGLMTMYEQFYIFPKFDYLLDPRTALLGCLISFAAAGSGAIASVRYVVKLPPSVAMRPPTPPAYHISLLEKVGLLNHFSASTKMIIRNIIRKPIHNLIATIGISLGVAIVVMGLFWDDAINYVINAQLMIAEREHISIAFTDPVKQETLHAIAKEPGVLAVEGYRAIPVRIRAGHRTYLTGLIGYLPETEQRLLLDSDLNPIAIPPDQLLISKGLSKILHIKAGDTVQVDVLEGKRPTLTVAVGSIVDDFIGVSAYAQFETVNRWLDENNLISGANLIYDEHQQDALYQSLKEIPKIATVTIKKKMITYFEETFANNLLVFTTFLVGFAMVIAVGIVYNSARIALSERAWDLASLRVLGFTRNEVTRILLG